MNIYSKLLAIEGAPTGTIDKEITDEVEEKTQKTQIEKIKEEKSLTERTIEYLKNLKKQIEEIGQDTEKFIKLYAFANYFVYEYYMLFSEDKLKSENNEKIAGLCNDIVKDMDDKLKNTFKFINFEKISDENIKRWVEEVIENQTGQKDVESMDNEKFKKWFNEGTLKSFCQEFFPEYFKNLEETKKNITKSIGESLNLKNFEFLLESTSTKHRMDSKKIGGDSTYIQNIANNLSNGLTSGFKNLIEKNFDITLNDKIGDAFGSWGEGLKNFKDLNPMDLNSKSVIELWKKTVKIIDDEGNEKTVSMRKFATEKALELRYKIVQLHINVLRATGSDIEEKIRTERHNFVLQEEDRSKAMSLWDKNVNNIKGRYDQFMDMQRLDPIFLYNKEKGVREKAISEYKGSEASKKAREISNKARVTESDKDIERTGNPFTMKQGKTQDESRQIHIIGSLAYVVKYNHVDPNYHFHEIIDFIDWEGLVDDKEINKEIGHEEAKNKSKKYVYTLTDEDTIKENIKKLVHEEFKYEEINTFIEDVVGNNKNIILLKNLGLRMVERTNKIYFYLIEYNPDITSGDNIKILNNGNKWNTPKMSKFYLTHSEFFNKNINQVYRKTPDIFKEYINKLQKN
jgi:hypothetical protein